MSTAQGFFERAAAAGVTPNMLSWWGLFTTLGCAVCLALGAGHALPVEAGAVEAPTSWWPVWAAFFLGLASALDLLDGALARHGGTASNYGALLDSTLDRFGDMAIFVGCGVYFATHGNATYTLLSGIALTATVQVSYVKARGENLTTGLGMGYWQRGERCALLILATGVGRVPFALWVLAIFPMLTVLRRYLEAKRKLVGDDRLPAAEAAALRLAPHWSRRSPWFWALASAIALATWAVPRWIPFFQGVADPLGDLLR